MPTFIAYCYECAASWTSPKTLVADDNSNRFGFHGVGNVSITTHHSQVLYCPACVLGWAFEPGYLEDREDCLRLDCDCSFPHKVGECS